MYACDNACCRTNAENPESRMRARALKYSLDALLWWPVLFQACFHPSGSAVEPFLFGAVVTCVSHPSGYAEGQRGNTTEV